MVEVRLALGGHVIELTNGLRYINRLISRLEVDIPYLISAQVLISEALTLVGPVCLIFRPSSWRSPW